MKIPTLTQKFIQDIRKKSKAGIYTCRVGDFEIDVFPYVFPPVSPFSESSNPIDEFGKLNRKQVLDVGTGTGILAMKAVLLGANNVDAVDIYEGAVNCARHNVIKNRLKNKINVWQSDLFSKVSEEKKYDLIIANLPIVDFPEDDVRWHSLIDPGFEYHERLFVEASDYLVQNGKMILPQADLQEKGFSKLEDLAEIHNFSYNVRDSINSLGHEWRNYEFFRK